MKIFFAAPLDTPDLGSVAHGGWDQIVDLGMGGVSTNVRWRDCFGCPITTLASLRRGFTDFRRIRELLDLGCGQLVDAQGLDWWEITAVYFAEELDTVFLLQRFAETVDRADHVYVSRPGLHADILQRLLPGRVTVFPLRKEAQKRGVGHYIRTSKKLSAPKIIDVLWDKYDPGYQFRGRFSRSPKPSDQPVVLLPTAYVNVSRTAVAYARTLPEEKFLLIATRNSGWMRNLPGNVSSEWLSSYASLRNRADETRRMEEQWQSLLDDLLDIPQFEILKGLGYFETFIARLRRGLEVRDAWQNVFESEPVQSVLCADDGNPYTRIPLLLARGRGLPTVSCHHGALDGYNVFKKMHADAVLAKGEMERDYLTRCCSLSPEKVEIGAPGAPAKRLAWKNLNSADRSRHILLISEAFEVRGGRTEDFYRDLLPPLADLALANGCRLVVKLHPAESKSERSGMLKRILSKRQQSVAEIVDGALTENLFSAAWFGITILSTVATDCAIRGIPCFLCRWLEAWPYGYVEQFIRFGVGIGLNAPEEIRQIPEYLSEFVPDSATLNNCWQPVQAERLRSLLISVPAHCAAVAS